MSTLTYPFPDPPADGSGFEIADGIYWLRLPIPMALDHINVWLLDNGEGWTLVDTGLCAPEIRLAWQGIFENLLNGKPITRIIVTHHHPDHFGQAMWLCEYFNTGLEITPSAYGEVNYLLNERSAEEREKFERYYRCHGVDDTSGLVKFHSGETYRKLISGIPKEVTPIGEEEIMIGKHAWEPIISNGHAAGHLSLYCRELGILISGDQILPEITSNISSYAKTPDANPLQEYFDSLAVFSNLPGQTLVLPSHGKVFRNLHHRIGEVEADHNEKLEKAFSFCNTPKNNVEVMEILFRRELKGLNWILAFGESLAHLRYLQENNRITCSVEDGKYYYHQ